MQKKTKCSHAEGRLQWSIIVFVLNGELETYLLTGVQRDPNKISKSRQNV